MKMLTTLLIAALALALNACASDRFLVGEAETWWSNEFSRASRSTSVDGAERAWSDDGKRAKSAYQYSVSRGEQIFSTDMEESAHRSSVTHADFILSQDSNWRELVRRFSVAQAEREWSRRAGARR